MRRAVVLAWFLLLAAGIVLAQTAAGQVNNSSLMPQTQIPSATPAQQSAPPAQQSAPPAQNPGTANQPANQNPSVTSPNLNPATAQTAPSPAIVDQIAAGTEIRAMLDTPLSTRTSRPGDRFTATIAEPAFGNNGQVVIPTGARIEGEVAEAEDDKTLAALKDKNALSVRFRDLVLPDGQTLPLTATLISVNDTTGKGAKKADEENRSEARNRNVAKGIGIGNRPGTAFGNPLKGLATGALANGGYVLSTKNKEVNLPAQTGMVIRLDQPVTATATPTPPQP
ncbi:MAG TPA: hypothetical protein VFR24_06820 [Candidatus Angelobacter sp.]|nr:hypothetical protein [Candidatus Angelobacter sp.]